MNSEWYKNWFNKDYVDLYAHRDDKEAKSQVNFLIKQLSNPKELNIIDIACGSGRHSFEFANLGHKVTGLDYSDDLLAIARKKQSNSEKQKDKENPIFIQGDMRIIPFEDSTFDLATSWFTSFGYFQQEEEHKDLLIEWNRVLKPKAFLLIDFLNKSYVEKTIDPLSITQNETSLVMQQREIRNNRIEKKITIESIQTGEKKVFEESVRLFEKEEIIFLLEKTNYSINKIWGDTQGNKHDENSKRLVLLSEKNS